MYGVTGSGKSTLARQLSELTGIGWTDVDHECWRPGWVQVPEAEQRRCFEDVCARPAWLLDTAYGTWRDVPLARADLVVALDYPRWVSLARLVRRTTRRVVLRRRVCHGNVESLGRAVGRESILRWHVRSFDRKRARIHEMAADPLGPPVVRLTSPRATARWLARQRERLG